MLQKSVTLKKSDFTPGTRKVELHKLGKQHIVQVFNTLNAEQTYKIFHSQLAAETAYFKFIGELVAIYGFGRTIASYNRENEVGSRHFSSR